MDGSVGGCAVTLTRRTKQATFLRYITHPEVAIDPHTPVRLWQLSAVGVLRAQALCRQPWVASIGKVVSSDETKALETAQVLALHLGLDIEVREGIGENDRSSTGFLPPDRFEQLADRFFAEPDRSVAGWERAVDAQARIVRGLADLLDDQSSGDVAVVGHGGVGTLWYCALSDRPIDRRHDQRGQGHFYTVDLSSHTVVHGWRPIDVLDAEPTGTPLFDV